MRISRAALPPRFAWLFGEASTGPWGSDQQRWAPPSLAEGSGSDLGSQPMLSASGCRCCCRARAVCPACCCQRKSPRPSCATADGSSPCVEMGLSRTPACGLAKHDPRPCGHSEESAWALERRLASVRGNRRGPSLSRAPALHQRSWTAAKSCPDLSEFASLKASDMDLHRFAAHQLEPRRNCGNSPTVQALSERSDPATTAERQFGSPLGTW